ncbi:hypothetical protein, partial [Microbacterium album]|uniref:hypothetical protein n=1 Tax=Microbacterium album TaxID=2053191 RepID=UPI001E343E17
MAPPFAIPVGAILTAAIARLFAIALGTPVAAGTAGPAGAIASAPRTAARALLRSVAAITAILSPTVWAVAVLRSHIHSSILPGKCRRATQRWVALLLKEVRRCPTLP